jgi:biotin synthase
MNFQEPFQSIIRKVMEGIGPTKEECKYLFTLEPHSLESTHMMSVANNLCRTRLNNCGIIYAQIGIDIAPCRVNCEFCSFAQKYVDIYLIRVGAL